MSCPSCGYCPHCGRSNYPTYTQPYGAGSWSYTIPYSGLGQWNAQLSAANPLTTSGYMQVKVGGEGGGNGGGGGNG